MRIGPCLVHYSILLTRTSNWHIIYAQQKLVERRHSRWGKISLSDTVEPRPQIWNHRCESKQSGWADRISHSGTNSRFTAWRGQPLPAPRRSLPLLLMCQTGMRRLPCLPSHRVWGEPDKVMSVRALEVGPRFVKERVMLEYGWHLPRGPGSSCLLSVTPKPPGAQAEEAKA